MVRLIAHLLAWIVESIASALDSPRRTRDLNRTLKWLARRLAGTHQPARRDFKGAVTWTVDGLSAMLYFLENEMGRIEGVAVRLRKPCSFRLRVFPETGWAKVRLFFGAQDLQTEDGAFDRAFIVQADRVAGARAVLTRDVREALAGVARVAPVSLELGPNGILVRTARGFADQLDQLVAFAEGALTLARALLLALDPSVVITEVESPGPGTCPVCSTAVDDDREVCGRCRTPHHKDCWDYLGGCAIFACAGRAPRNRGAA